MLQSFQALLFLCLVPTIALYAGGAHYALSKTVITVKGIHSGFEKEVIKKGHNPAGNQHQVQIGYTELEQIQSLVAIYHNGKKDIVLKPTDFNDYSLLTSSFYDGLRARGFSYPVSITGYSFNYSYTVAAKELMFLSSLYLHSEKVTDTIEYTINLPDSLLLLYRVDGDTVSNGQFHSSQNGNSYTFRFVRNPRAEQKKVLPLDIPVVRLLVVKKHGSQSPVDYFASWYHGMAAIHAKLSENMKSILASSLGNKASAKDVFDWVKKSITYIDIENGIGAIQPRDVNAVFEQKQGDCKDMASLLCQSLRFMGYEAYLAISSTLSHRFDLDFPTISSANHVICVLRYKGKWIYLDATERYGAFGVPSRQIQGRHILIVYPEGGELHYIEPVNANANVLSANYQLTPNQALFEGVAEYSLNGFQQYDLQYYRQYHTAAEFQTKATQYFTNYSPAIQQTFVSCTPNNTADNLTYVANVRTGKVVTQVGSKNYLSATFLPWPHNLPAKVDTQATYLTYMQHINKFSVNLNFTDSIKLLGSTNIDFSENGFSFRYSVSQPDSQHLVIDYSCQIDHLIVDAANVKNLIALNEAIQTAFSKAITYEKL